jgi:hypothetical protein
VPGGQAAANSIGSQGRPVSAADRIPTAAPSSAANATTATRLVKGQRANRTGRRRCQSGLLQPQARQAAQMTQWQMLQ